MDYLRNSQPKTQTHDCGYLEGPSQVPLKVGMLSERALRILYVVHIYERRSGYRLTRRVSSPIPVIHSLGSNPPDTPLHESVQMPLDSVRILLFKAVCRPNTPVLLRLGPKVLPRTRGLPHMFLPPGLRCVWK